MGLFRRNMIQKLNNSVDHSNVLHLANKEVVSLHVTQSNIQFHLIEGRAWITYDDNDIIVESGETINIPTSKHRVLISSANKYKTIRYQIA